MTKLMSAGLVSCEKGEAMFIINLLKNRTLVL